MLLLYRNQRHSPYIHHPPDSQPRTVGRDQQAGSSAQETRQRECQLEKGSRFLLADAAGRYRLQNVPKYAVMGFVSTVRILPAEVKRQDRMNVTGRAWGEPGIWRWF